MRFQNALLPFLFMLILLPVACGDNLGGENGTGPGQDTLPEIMVSPDSLKFSPLLPGETQTLSVSVQNTGAGDALDLQNIWIRDEGMPYTVSQLEDNLLGEGDTTTLYVTYEAEATSPAETFLMIKSNAATEPLVMVPLTVGAQLSGVTIFPDPIQFGEVLGGDTKVVNVTITNSGSMATSIMNAYLSIESSDDFEIFDPPVYPVMLKPGDYIALDLAYTPLGGGADQGELAVAFNEAGAQALATIPVFGTEVGPEINIAPPLIDFGYVAKEETVEKELTLFNMGEHDLKILSVYTAPMSNEDVHIENAPAGSLTVKPGKSETLVLTFSPTEFFATTGDPIGGIVIESNDSDEAIVNVPVYGNIDSPFIKVEPPDTVLFGIVAQGWTIERSVTIENIGHAPLTVYGLEISENSPASEFGLIEDGAFPPTEGGEGTVMPGSSAVAKVTFHNGGGASGQELGKLHIVSDDPLTPDIYINLNATRGGSPSCKLAYVPGKLEFGTVAHGAEKVQTMFIKNAGSGYCSFKSGMVKECVSFMGLMSTCMDNGGPSDNFMPLGMPIPVMDGMAPGTSHPVQMKYKPPTSAPWIPIFEEYYGVFQITYTEPYTVPNEFTEHKLPEPDATGTLQWNIHGSSGVADIAVLPPEIDFGLVTIGCYSQTVCVKVYNAGTAPLQVTDIYLDGCGVPSEFQLKDYPALPTDIGESKYEEVCAVYLPQNEGPDQCKIVIESSDLDSPVTHVPLSGEGTWETENTDQFTQISGKKVDILFVVDESASMCGEQDNIADNFNTLTSLAAQWGNDFQIGITTTNIDEDNDDVGKLFGEPTIIDKSSVGKFGDNMEDVGCGGSGAQESGLEAGRRALSPPLMAEGGYNEGFVRTDAALEVVFVSDEEDQSPGSVPFYIDYYRSIKGFLNEDMFHAHAIVGDKNGGCKISQDEGADAGKRYIEVQDATGGVFGSICDSSFSQVLEDIGNKAFGLQIQFFLSAQADSTPGSVKVWVNGQECLAGWNYDTATNAVIFDEDGACMPQAGDEIQIWYKMVCNTE